MTNRQIAEALFVTVKTVGWHLGNAYRKLGVGTREELAARFSSEDEGHVTAHNPSPTPTTAAETQTKH
jgi:hypothetical protein